MDGHTYRMSCDPGEEARVEALAHELDGTIRALKGRIGEIGDRRIAVMAALTMLDRLKSAEEKIATLSEENVRLERARERAALTAEADDEPLIARIDAATEAIERLTAEFTGQVRSSQSQTASADAASASFSRVVRRTPIAPPDDAPSPEEPAPDDPSATGPSAPSFARRS
nr:cell division protein ZapA [Acuticoccus sp. I52.16.1]